MYPRQSAACSCSHGVESPVLGENAPRDTKVWLPIRTAEGFVWLFERATQPKTVISDGAVEASQSFGERLSAALKLSGPENRQIAYRLTEHHFGGIGDFVAVEPLDELDPGPYRLQVRAKRQEDLQKVVGDEDLFFNVTSSPSAPPPPPSVHIESWFRNEPQGMCRSRKAARLRLRNVGWLVAYEIDRPSEKGKAVSPELHYLQPRDDELIVGDGACGVHWRFDETPAVIRLATVDLAGRISEWSAEFPLEPPWPMGELPSAFSMSAAANHVEGRRGCGCYLQDSSQKANRRDVLVYVFLAGLAYAARRKRKRQSCPTRVCI